jgi:autotransporter translocation and assembly factor TamB
LHGLEVDALAVKGHLEKSSLYLEDARAVALDSSLTITRGIIPIPATVEAFESVPINLSVRFESSNLEGLAGLFGDMPLNGQVAADMSIAGSIKEPKGKITLSGEHLRYKELQLGSLALQGELRASQDRQTIPVRLHLSPPQLPSGSRIHFHSLQSSSSTDRVKLP